MNGCRTHNFSNDVERKVIGLGIGSPVETNDNIHKKFMREYRAGVRHKYGFVSPVYAMSLHIHDELKIDAKSKYMMEDVAYKGLENAEIQKEYKWNNDYIRGSFEVLTLVKRKNRYDELCKQFVQKIYVKKELFLFDGFGCKKSGEGIWRVKQTNKTIF
jgi:hypothetical protein